MNNPPLVVLLFPYKFKDERRNCFPIVEQTAAGCLVGFRS
jgi:hypothetical protein